MIRQFRWTMIMMLTGSKFILQVTNRGKPRKQTIIHRRKNDSILYKGSAGRIQPISVRAGYLWISFGTQQSTATKAVPLSEDTNFKHMEIPKLLNLVVSAWKPSRGIPEMTNIQFPCQCHSISVHHFPTFFHHFFPGVAIDYHRFIHADSSSQKPTCINGFFTTSGMSWAMLLSSAWDEPATTAKPLPRYPYAPWCWNIYQHLDTFGYSTFDSFWVIWIHLGTSSSMEHITGQRSNKNPGTVATASRRLLLLLGHLHLL